MTTSRRNFLIATGVASASVLTGTAPAVATTSAPSFVLGATEPTWENTGCRPSISQLKRNETTNLVTSYDGQVIERVHLPYGRIELRHKNVTIRDCYIQIGWDSKRAAIHGNCGVVANPNYDTSGVHMDSVTIDPLNAGYGGTADDAQVNGFYFIGGTAWRCSVRNVTDGFMPDINKWSSAPSKVLGCYAQTRWLPYDKEQSDGTHNDGVQIAGGNGNMIRGNALHNPVGGVKDPATGSVVRGQCVVLTPYHGAITNTIIDKNWLYGAYTQISAWPRRSEGGPDCAGTTVAANRHSGRCVWPLLVTPEVQGSAKDISGNVAGSGGVSWNSGYTAAGSAISPYVAAAYS